MNTTTHKWGWQVAGSVLALIIGGCASSKTSCPTDAPPCAKAPAHDDQAVDPAPAAPNDTIPLSPPPKATPKPTPTPTPAPAPAPAPPTTTTTTTTKTTTPPPSPAPAAEEGAQAEGRRVEYAPHVFIDWSVPQVEVAAQVVKREGPLELLLCGTGTKEHESILATSAAASKIYEAMGLIGLESGQPASYDPQTQQATPSSGQRLRLEIHQVVGAGRRIVAAHEWLSPTDGEGTIAPPRWVFAGSTMNEAGKLSAGADGTLVCVVDFETALVALGEAHTADNAALWTKANTAVIPADGVECLLVIRALDETPLVLTLTPENYFRWNDTILDALELDALIRERTLHNPEQSVVLNETPGEPNPFARLAAAAIVGSGIKRENLTANLLPRESQAAPAPAPADPTDVQE